MNLEKEAETYLIAAVDESNEISEITNRAEVVAVTFSEDIQDGVYLAYAREKDDRKAELLKDWMSRKGKDYRFATLTNMDVRKFQPIASVVTEPLIRNYLDYLKSKGVETADHLRLFVDSILSAEHRTYLKNAFSKDFQSVIVRNIIKRDRIYAVRRKGRKLVGPKAIQMADILAYELYHGRDYDGAILPPNQLFNHPKRVNLDENTLLKIIAEEKSRRQKR